MFIYTHLYPQVLCYIFLHFLWDGELACCLVDVYVCVGWWVGVLVRVHVL